MGNFHISISFSEEIKYKLFSKVVVEELGVIFMTILLLIIDPKVVV